MDGHYFIIFLHYNVEKCRIKAFMLSAIFERVKYAKKLKLL